MMKKKKWDDVPGCLYIELEFSEDYGLVWVGRKKKWTVKPELAKKLLNILADPELWPIETEVLELGIDFTSSGFYDPGVTSGPVEGCYPSDCDDERTCTGACLYGDGQHDVLLSDALAEECFCAFESQIYSAEIEEIEYDYY